jgi:halimadienyl-diphosphate synthase
VLWNLGLTGLLDGELRPLCEPHLQALEPAWINRRGIGFGTGYSIHDGDDSSLVYAVLTKFGRSIDVDAMYHYEEPDHFRCFELETNPSISANVHFLEAFHQAGLERDHPVVQKILRFLAETQQSAGYWIDKWHASPYYTTAHFVISANRYDGQLSEAAVQWILDTQNADGSWGFYFPTAEETAYALQALCIWRQNGGKVAGQVIGRGAGWLAAHLEPPYPPLWIAKTLFFSEWVVRSELISALILAEQN